MVDGKKEVTGAANGARAKSGKFKPGISGNPKGRRTGSRSKALLALDRLGEGEAEDILKAVIEKAKDGDAQSARTILDRVWPVRKGARLTFDLPTVESASDLPAAIAAVTRQVAEGEITAEEGTAIVGMLEAHRKAIETSELSTRIAALEERLAKK